MASTVIRSQSNRAPLGCGGTGDSHHECAADKSAHLRNVLRSEKCFQHLFESMPRRIKGVYEGKSGSNPVLARCI